MWEIYLASIVAGVLIIGGTVAHFWKKEEGPLSEERQPQRRQTAPAADIEQPVKLTAEEKRKSQREAHILSSIIHKVSSYRFRSDCITVYLLADRL